MRLFPCPGSVVNRGDCVGKMHRMRIGNVDETTLAMSTRINYHQISTKLNYASLEKHLDQLRNQEPPKTRKRVADLLNPIADRLRDLRAKKWTYAQIAKELSDAGLTIKANAVRGYLTAATEKAPHSKQRKIDSI
jgi:hypothetical protein